MRDNTPWLRPVNADRRERPNANGDTGVTTARRLRAFNAALEERRPGASRWIDFFKPFTDAKGVWHPGAVLRTRPRPLTVAECLVKQREHGRAF